MSERLLYLDCFSGIAGDMLLGALIDLGVDVVTLRQALGTLPLDGWSLEVAEARRMGLRGVDVQILINGAKEGPAVPVEAHETAHAEGHAHDHDTHYHYADIVRIIEGGRLPPEVSARARAAFEVLAAAEARVHGEPLDHVHFHEVGAVDSIIDIVGCAYGIWALGIDAIESAPPPLGRGFIRCAHGRMPSPAPATLEILTGVMVGPAGVDRELVTPTGAAFVKAWARRVGPFPEMHVERVGFGVGDIELADRPNLLRAVLGRKEPGEASCTVIEANLDDMSAELAGYLLEQLFEAGARDAWFIPLHMKKNRPGIMVGALADEGARARVEDTLLRESTAIGLRRFPVARLKLERTSTVVETTFGAVPVKIAWRDGRPANIAPEFEPCARLAREKGVPLKEIYQHAVAAYLNRAEPR